MQNFLRTIFGMGDEPDAKPKTVPATGKPSRVPDEDTDADLDVTGRLQAGVNAGGFWLDVHAEGVYGEGPEFETIPMSNQIVQPWLPATPYQEFQMFGNQLVMVPNQQPVKTPLATPIAVNILPNEATLTPSYDYGYVFDTREEGQPYTLGEL